MKTTVISNPRSQIMVEDHQSGDTPMAASGSNATPRYTVYLNRVQTLSQAFFRDLAEVNRLEISFSVPRHIPANRQSVITAFQDYITSRVQPTIVPLDTDVRWGKLELAADLLRVLQNSAENLSEKLVEFHDRARALEKHADPDLNFAGGDLGTLLIEYACAFNQDFKTQYEDSVKHLASLRRGS